jgi:hypothetical protein
MTAGRGWAADVGENPPMGTALSRLKPEDLQGHPIEEVASVAVRPSLESAQRAAAQYVSKAIAERRYFGPWVGLVIAKLDAQLVYDEGDEPDPHDPGRYDEPSGLTIRHRIYVAAVPVEELLAELIRLGREDGYALVWETTRSKETALKMAKLELAEARSDYSQNAMPGYTLARKPLADIKKEHRRVAFAAMHGKVASAYR